MSPRPASIHSLRRLRRPALACAGTAIAMAAIGLLVACGGGSDAASTSSATSTGTVLTITGADTAGIECSYRYDAFNSSASVGLTSIASWTCSTTARVLAGNGVPDHAVGTFPNPDNPNTITAQTVAATIPLTPTLTGTATPRGGPAGVLGFVLNGVKIDAGTGGSCDDSGTVCSLGDPSGNWQIEALGQSSFSFGTDANNAHVQPDGTYHYHGMPEGFVTQQGGSATRMTLIGWAADGFPIYARYGYAVATDASSAIKQIKGSYLLVTTVSASRPATTTYALGTFLQDWQYVAGSGDLDECNGRYGVTPEFPAGIYHYYATDSYPYFQRCVKGAVTTTPATGTTPPPPPV